MTIHICATCAYRDNGLCLRAAPYFLAAPWQTCGAWQRD